MADEKKSDRNTEKETRKMVSEDVEKFFRDVWGKVVEYASLGAEEATKVSTSAKVRVDIETLKFKRGKLIKMLGERYWDIVTKEPSLAVVGTGELIRQIKSLDKEIRGLEKEIGARGAKPTGKKTAAKRAAPGKASAVKPKTAKATSGKTGGRKSSTAKTSSRAKAGAAKKPAPTAPPPEEPVASRPDEEK